jgi:hypothetical protein
MEGQPETYSGLYIWDTLRTVAILAWKKLPPRLTGRENCMTNTDLRLKRTTTHLTVTELWQLFLTDIELSTGPIVTATDRHCSGRHRADIPPISTPASRRPYARKLLITKFRLLPDSRSAGCQDPRRCRFPGFPGHREIVKVITFFSSPADEHIIYYI